MRRCDIRHLAAVGVAGGLIGAGIAMSGASALAAAGGNSGDVWGDTVGQPAGPGHEMDPHLPCADINLWGAKLADGSGTYSIDGWPPSGSQEQVYASSWTYSAAQGGTQVISVISVSTLIASGAALGDTPQSQQGYHFKLEFSQDPQKHKTFWVNCPAPSTGHPTPTPSPASSPTPGGGGGGEGTPTAVPSPTPSPAGGTGGVTSTPGASPSGGVQGITTSMPPTPVVGVLGIATSIPATGAAISLAGLGLLVGGAVVLALARRRRNARIVEIE